MATQETARYRAAEQRGSVIGSSGFSESLWTQARRMATHGIAGQRKKPQGIAQQSNADRSLAAVAFPSRYGLRRDAWHSMALQGNAWHCRAEQRGKDESLPDRFDLKLSRYSSAALLTKKWNFKMAIQQANVKITGLNYLLQNNPQTVDPFNRYSKAMKVITKKKTGKTEDDLIELGNIETESKLYFDDELKVYVPTRWLTEAICTAAFATIKIGKDKMRGGIFATEDKAKLQYKGMDKVKKIEDIVMNPMFRHRAILPKGQVRIPKDFPIFKDWSFGTVIEFDDTVVDFASLKQVVERTAKYVGFGDFRPTFGRATAEVQSV